MHLITVSSSLIIPRKLYVGYFKIKLRLVGKKYKTENKTLLYGIVTYITELLLHTVAIDI
jgi:hypothetical protein